MSRKLLLATKMYDENYNIFKFDTSLTAEDKTVTLSTNRRGDTTSYDGVTDWGDGTIDNTASHTYTNDGIYLVKTKYILDESNDNDNNTRKKLIDCININKNMNDLSDMFNNCINVVEFTNSSNWDTSNAKYMDNMFSWCDKLITLDVSKWNTSNVIDMSGLFFNCNSLTVLDVTDWDTSNVTNMYNMFSYCINLTTLNVSKWDTSNVTDMSSMFYNCNKLITLDVSKWDTSNVTDMGGLFFNCNSLTLLDVTDWDTSNVIDMNSMFNGCSSLIILNVSKWDTSNVISDLFF